ncbi:MAG: glycosyltransferase [Terracidiphilus sp.]
MLVIAIPSLDPEKFSGAVQAAKAAGAMIAFLPRLAAISSDKVECADIDGIVLNVVRKAAKDRNYEIAKRAFDLISALALMILSAPVLAVIAILVRCDSPGPVLFRQQRVGRNGRLFTMYKLLAIHRAAGTWEKCVSRFIALTEFARAKFIAGGLPAEKFVVKPNFVDPDPGIGSGSGNFALFVGRLVAEKGIGTLLTAWKELRGGPKLRIIGDGPLGPAVASAAATHPDIEWNGPRDPEEVRGAMKEAKVLILPSTWYEAFGLVAVEAFAAGLPVIASRLGAMEELVSDGVTGRLFSAGDPSGLASAVRWAFCHPEELKGMRSRARLDSSENIPRKPTTRASWPSMQRPLEVVPSRCSFGNQRKFSDTALRSFAMYPRSAEREPFLFFNRESIKESTGRALTSNYRSRKR